MATQRVWNQFGFMRPRFKQTKQKMNLKNSQKLTRKVKLYFGTFKFSTDNEGFPLICHLLGGGREKGGARD